MLPAPLMMGELRYTSPAQPPLWNPWLRPSLLVDV